jgi:O-antigen/teichoic acid export membrane protein
MSLVKNLLQITISNSSAASLARRFAAGMSWTVAGTLFRQAANFSVGIYLARVLGIADFGKFAVIQSTIVMLAGFGQAGIGLSATRQIAAMRSSDRLRTGSTIGFALTFTAAIASVLSLLLIFFSLPIESALLPGSELSAELRVAGVWILFELVNLVQFRVLAGLEAFRGGAIINVWQSILLPVAVAGALWGGVKGALAGMACASLMSCVVGQVVLDRECSRFGIEISFRNMWQERGILRMSSMVWLSSIAMNITNWLLGILLVRHPAGIVEFSLYNAAGRFQSVLLFLPTRIFEVSIPVLSNLHSTGDRAGFRRSLAYAGSVTFAFSAAVSMLMALFAERLMSWYGTDFTAGTEVLRYASLCCIASSVWSVASAGLWASGRSGQMLMLDVFRALIPVGLCLAGLASSAVSLTVAQIVSYAVALVFLLYLLFRPGRG